jgi:hypothetical protein
MPRLSFRVIGTCRIFFCPPATTFHNPPTPFSHFYHGRSKRFLPLLNRLSQMPNFSFEAAKYFPSVCPRPPLNASGTGGFWLYRISLLLNTRCERNQAALRSIAKTSPPHSVLVQFWRLKRLNLSPAPDEGVRRTRFTPAGFGSTKLAFS